MEDDVKEAYGIAAAISEALEAAVFADSSACYKAYEMIEKFAYDEPDDADNGSGAMNPSNSAGNTEKDGEKSLAMAKFSMKDSNGRGREISIPLVTMMPLPLLHVTEADFDITMNVSIEDTDVVETTVGSGSAVPTFRRKIGAAIVPTARALTGRQMVVKGQKKSSSNSKTTTVDVHVKVKMEQAELPEGIKLMLQAAANSIQSEATKLKE